MGPVVWLLIGRHQLMYHTSFDVYVSYIIWLSYIDLLIIDALQITNSFCRIFHGRLMVYFVFSETVVTIDHSARMPLLFQLPREAAEWRSHPTSMQG